jgi:CDP-6-deoxy-D-xylo-4-hexulose-3-dehydrase
MIKLVNDTISTEEIDAMIDWLKTYPKLTKGKQTEIFEKAWSAWVTRKYSVFVNSGSSANLVMLYALKLSGRMKNDKVIVPCVSWTTTVSPVIQLGMTPIPCEASTSNLGLDTVYFEKLCKEHNPACVLIVHVLGIPNYMSEILNICEKYNVILLEDSCESVGSQYENKTTGTFGLMSSFSTYYGHHFSTIEGGLVSTDDFELYEVMKSLRSHGWSRDLSDDTRERLRIENNIDKFRDLYTFYYPGFNLRSTEIQAFLGVNQLKTLDSKNETRYLNLLKYDSLIENDFWKVEFGSFTSNFAYPIIHPEKNEIVHRLEEGGVECRPLVCGNIARQPYYEKMYGKKSYKVADMVHDFGFYVPNNPNMKEEEIIYICNIINEVTRKTI